MAISGKKFGEKFDLSCKKTLAERAEASLILVESQIFSFTEIVICPWGMNIKKEI